MYPILAEPFGFPIKAFGLMVALGFLSGYWFSAREARRTGKMTEEAVGDLLMWLIFGGLIGARILYVIVQWDEQFRHHPGEIFKIWNGGIVYYGGLLGAIFAGWLFCRKHDLRFAMVGDIHMPGVMLGQAVGRIGCLLVGDDFGREAPGLSWAIVFPSPTKPGNLFGLEIPPTSDSLMPPDMVLKELHPAQIYMGLQAFAIFLILAWVARRQRFEGQVMYLALMLYPIGRSICEIYRADNDARGVYFDGAISTSQLISIPLFLFGLIGFIRAARQPATEATP